MNNDAVRFTDAIARGDKDASSPLSFARALMSAS